ncbi:MAG: trypsin-like peptidase domain-containing protein [Gammaproteobacteria bacterium]|nr:trypsin-like peptidase domain-containing protein [Gammaproteobacteria bacterium]
MVVWYLLPVVEQAIIGSTATPRTVDSRGDLASDERSTIEIFERVSPSVVYITTVRRVLNPWTRDVMSMPRGTGSGFIWDGLGHLVTNHHVIQDVSEARVRLNDGRSYSAVLVGSSPDHDIAVLRIRVPFNRPPAVPIGSSEDLRVGQKVFAIGNPFGLDYTLTTGIVSALDRSLSGEGDTSIDHLIQTDAAINPGNSGGPLLDSAGRLIGVNTAIYSPSGAYAGIGFAVPVDTVNRVVPELIAKGRYVRPVLGIEVSEELNKIVSDQLGERGVLVLRTTPGSVAEMVGIQGTVLDSQGEIRFGDFILAVGGTPVSNLRDLLSRLDDYQTGDTTSLLILRDGERLEITITL